MVPPKMYVAGLPLHISCGAQLRYVNVIDHYVLHMITEVRNQITAFYEKESTKQHLSNLNDETGMDADSVGSGIRILSNAFKRQFEKLFGGLSATLSENMVADINNNSKQSLNASVKEINRKTEGEKLSLDPAMMDAATVEVLKASIARSTNFIRSIPSEYISNVNDAILASIQTGNGLPDIIAYLDKQGNTTKNWSHNTAMDQTRKTYNSLNASRMKNAGIKRGKWLHSGGSQHPRPKHIAFDGKTFDLNKGAPVGDGDDDPLVMPGDDPNCRCTFTPILDDLFASNDE
jgi:SPP1 gp7 family putative phage head morphogenesis protein